ncbi:MAG: hypothetical protein WED00_18000 [Aquisalimonadaceae bacterium]
MKPTMRKLALEFAGMLPAIMLAVPVMAYETVEVRNGGVIEGRVTYEGRIPTRKIVPTKDREVCGDVRDWEQAEVGPDNGLKNAVVHLQRVERGKPWPDGSDMKTPVIDNKNCVFEPHVQVVPPGEIDIHNSDPVLHNTKGYYGRRAVFNLALPDEGMTITRELARPGVVRFACDAHGWMEAWAYVLDHPYFAVTDENGAFRITDIPPGEYTLITRQEYIGATEQTVEVGEDETIELSLELSQ